MLDTAHTNSYRPQMAVASGGIGTGARAVATESRRTGASCAPGELPLLDASCSGWQAVQPAWVGRSRASGVAGSVGVAVVKLDVGSVRRLPTKVGALLRLLVAACLHYLAQVRWMTLGRESAEPVACPSDGCAFVGRRSEMVCPDDGTLLLLVDPPPPGAELTTRDSRAASTDRSTSRTWASRTWALTKYWYHYLTARPGADRFRYRRQRFARLLLRMLTALAVMMTIALQSPVILRVLVMVLVSSLAMAAIRGYTNARKVAAVAVALYGMLTWVTLSLTESVGLVALLAAPLILATGVAHALVSQAQVAHSSFRHRGTRFGVAPESEPLLVYWAGCLGTLAVVAAGGLVTLAKQAPPLAGSPRPRAVVRRAVIHISG